VTKLRTTQINADLTVLLC